MSHGVRLFLHRTLRKMFRLALRSECVHRVVGAAASRLPAHLPDVETADEVLRAMHEPPERHFVAPDRSRWPETPEVDVTVIIPCYNVEKYVEEAMASITKQVTTRRIEIIAVDDGSSDNTLELLSACASRDGRIRVISQENSGHGGARNVGLENARGSYITFVDADDLLPDGALETLCDAADIGHCDLVSGKYRMMSSDGSFRWEIPGKRRNGGPCGRLFSREVWRNLYFPEGLWFEDTVHAFCIASRFAERLIDDVVYDYRKNASGISSQSIRSRRSVDHLYVTATMVEWAQALDVPFDARMTERLLVHLGPVAVGRLTAFSERQRRAFFVLACELFGAVRREGAPPSGMSGRWERLERSLVARDYWCWRVACLATQN